MEPLLPVSICLLVQQFRKSLLFCNIETLEGAANILLSIVRASKKKKRGAGYAVFYQQVIPTGFKKMLFVFQPLRGGILVAKKTSHPLFFLW